MENEIKKIKINSLNSIANRYFAAMDAEKIQAEHQVRKFCVTPIIEHVWGFVAGFGETGTYTEEEEYAAGTSNVKVDNVLHCYDGKVVVESKAPNEDLDRHIPQLTSYVRLSCSSIGIITNGREWRFYLANRNGEMLDTPFKVVDIKSASEQDAEFFVTMFNPKYTINASSRRKEQESREKNEEAHKKLRFFISALKDFTENPSDEWIKDQVRTYEKIASVSSSKLEDYRNGVVRTACLALKKEISQSAIVEEQKRSNKKNRVEAGELAIYNGCRVYAKLKGVSLKFVDDDDARFSHVEDAVTGRKLMYIVGDVDENTGWSLRGIAFPNRTKGKGAIIQCSTVEEVDCHLETLMWVAENIGRSAGEWASLYDAKFGEL